MPPVQGKRKCTKKKPNCTREDPHYTHLPGQEASARPHGTRDAVPGQDGLQPSSAAGSNDPGHGVTATTSSPVASTPPIGAGPASASIPAGTAATASAPPAPPAAALPASELVNGTTDHPPVLPALAAPPSNGTAPPSAAHASSSPAAAAGASGSPSIPPAAPPAPPAVAPQASGLLDVTTHQRSISPAVAPAPPSGTAPSVGLPSASSHTTHQGSVTPAAASHHARVPNVTSVGLSPSLTIASLEAADAASRCSPAPPTMASSVNGLVNGSARPSYAPTDGDEADDSDDDMKESDEDDEGGEERGAGEPPTKRKRGTKSGGRALACPRTVGASLDAKGIQEIDQWHRDHPVFYRRGDAKANNNIHTLLHHMLVMCSRLFIRHGYFVAFYAFDPDCTIQRGKRATLTCKSVSCPAFPTPKTQKYAHSAIASLNECALEWRTYFEQYHREARESQKEIEDLMKKNAEMKKKNAEMEAEKAQMAAEKAAKDAQMARMREELDQLRQNGGRTGSTETRAVSMEVEEALGGVSTISDMETTE